MRGDTLELYPAYEEQGLGRSSSANDLERISRLDPLTGERLEEMNAWIITGHALSNLADKLSLAWRASARNWPNGCRC